MATKRSRRGDRTASDRAHVGLTVPRRVKADLLEAAAALDWSAGDWALAAAAEEGPRLLEALGHVEVRKRPHVEDAAFTALYLTPDERDELDDQAIACGLNRSAFVTSVARLALGEELEAVVAPLRAAAPKPPRGGPAVRPSAVHDDSRDVAGTPKAVRGRGAPAARGPETA